MVIELLLEIRQIRAMTELMAKQITVAAGLRCRLLINSVIQKSNGAKLAGN